MSLHAVQLKQDESRGLRYNIDGRPDFSLLTVEIPAGQSLKVEASAMASLDTNVRMQTKFRGGLGRFLTGESLFMNEFTAQNSNGEIKIAPAASGDIEHVAMSNNTIYLQNNAFVACTTGVNIETKFQGLVKGFFSGEKFFLIKCSGTGDLWFNTYGALIELPVDGDYVVDTGHIVAFTEGLEYKVESVGGYKSLFLSGEGLVCRFRGQGKVWVQTRKLQPFLNWVNPFRRIQKKSSS